MNRTTHSQSVTDGFEQLAKHPVPWFILAYSLDMFLMIHMWDWESNPVLLTVGQYNAAITKLVVLVLAMLTWTYLTIDGGHYRRPFEWAWAGLYWLVFAANLIGVLAVVTLA